MALTNIICHTNAFVLPSTRNEASKLNIYHRRFIIKLLLFVYFVLTIYDRRDKKKTQIVHLKASC